MYVCTYVHMLLKNIGHFTFCAVKKIHYAYCASPPSLQFIGSQKLPPPKTNKKGKLARHGSMLALAAFARHNDVDGCPSLRLAVLCYVSCALPCALCPVLCRVSWVLCRATSPLVARPRRFSTASYF